MDKTAKKIGLVAGVLTLIACIAVIYCSILLTTELPDTRVSVSIENPEEYSIESLTPETVKVTGYLYLAMKELKEKYVIKKIEPAYGDPKRRFTATEYTITVELKSSQ